VCGRVELGEGSATLRETLKNVSAGSRKILLNLTDVSFMDTSGIGELASGHALAQNEGRKLKLTGIPKRVAGLLQMTGLDGILDIYDNETEAIQSWSENLVGASPGTSPACNTIAG